MHCSNIGKLTFNEVLVLHAYFLTHKQTKKLRNISGTVFIFQAYNGLNIFQALYFHYAI